MHLLNANIPFIWCNRLKNIIAFPFQLQQLSKPPPHRRQPSPPAAPDNLCCPRALAVTSPPTSLPRRPVSASRAAHGRCRPHTAGALAASRHRGQAEAGAGAGPRRGCLSRAAGGRTPASSCSVEAFLVHLGTEPKYAA